MQLFSVVSFEFVQDCFSDVHVDHCGSGSYEYSPVSTPFTWYPPSYPRVHSK